MDKNKPTAGRTKAIHRRLELSFNLYLLLLLWVKTELSKKPPTYNPGFSASCSFSTNKTFEGQLKPSKPFCYRRFSWLPLLYLHPLSAEWSEHISGRFQRIQFYWHHHIPHRSHDVPICCSMSPDSPAAPSVCTALLPRSPRRPLSTTFCGQKQQASISLSFSLSCLPI